MTAKTTETASVRYDGIENWATADVTEAILESQMAAAAIAAMAAPTIAQAVDRAAERIGQAGRLIYLGAGTSGRIATQDATELLPTYAWPAERALALMAGGNAALTQSIEGAEDDGDAAAKALDDVGVGPTDVVIGVAASGTTPFAVGGVRHARAQGALTIGVQNNPAGPLADAAEIAIIAATGPELVAGSTRMKAGTAQKIVLNAFSTALMIRMGYVYHGRMVEMAPSNDKLARRARTMVADLAGVAEDEAANALAKADGSIKIAVVMLMRGVDRAAAEQSLAAHDGHLGRTLAAGA